MSHSRYARRDFLRAAAAVGSAVVPALCCATARGIEPIKREAGAKFKFSLAAYSYRKLLGGKSPSLSIEDFVRDCARMQLDGTELTSYYLPAEPTPAYLRQLRRQAFELGLDVSGTAVRNDFCHVEGPERDEQIAHVKRWVDHAALLGAPVIRIFSGNTPRGTSEQEARRRAVAAIEECCDYAGTHGVMLALENHGGLTTTIEGILDLVRAVRSPWFGANLDTGNFHGDEPYADLKELAPYAVNVQVKAAIRPADGRSQPADFKRLAQIVRDAGYRGYIVLEYEEGGDPRTECPRLIDELRAAFTT